MMRDLIGQGFLKEALHKACVLLVCAMSVSWLLWGSSQAFAILGGGFVMAANMVFISLMVRRMLAKEDVHRSGLVRLVLLFMLKLLVLFGLTYYVVVVLGLSAMGYMGGYMVFLTAMLWQGLSPPQQNV